MFIFLGEIIVMQESQRQTVPKHWFFLRACDLRKRASEMRGICWTRKAPRQAFGSAVIDLLSASVRGAAGRDRCYLPHL